ncbi:MAG: hypothetical protein IT423_12650, partial [Pirellulaceae bacterium]|nr:hypothetical protein [Pirellulaceae bacterium]
LAAQTLSLLGNWDWVASPKGSLSDARDRSFWTPLLDGTRQILAAHPENVEALQSALQSLDADAVGWRTDMWLGLDSAQLSGDGLGKLVKTLESDILLDRILAIYQLQRVTGKDLGYQAGEPSRAATSQWTRELTNGRLTPAPL